MAESSPLRSVDEQQLLQAALEHPFEPTEVTLSSSSSSISPPSSLSSAPPSLSEPAAEEDTWQTTYSAQVSEWRAQSASARSKAELTRAKWEAIRSHETAERHALGQPPESWDRLGDHITASTAAARDAVSHSLSASLASLSSVEHSERSAEAEHAQRGKGDSGSPTQPWEHISSSPTSSYPSTGMSFPEASLPQSPNHLPTLLAPTSASAQVHARLHPIAGRNPTQPPPSTFPSIMDRRVAPRTRLSLVLSSLAINLFLPFINGVMLGFGEIFAKDVLVAWLGWKRPGNTAAGLGLRR